MSDEPKKVELSTPDLAAEKLAAFEDLFPGVVADGVLDVGRLTELLEIEPSVVPDGRERYGLMWGGKNEAIRSLLTPSRATLLPDSENSVDFDNAQNVFIEGDNLEVLKLLQKAYNDRVKLIYIDPPYNTGGDFVYEDDFSDGLNAYLAYTGQIDNEGKLTRARTDAAGRFHSRWMSMIYPRLVLGRNLLTPDGLFAVSIDDNEVANLREMLDEVFGQENFVAQIIVQANKGGRDYLPIAQTHEYLLIYARNYATAGIYDLPKGGEALPLADARGPYEARELRNRNPKFHRGNRPNLFYPFYADPENVDEYGFSAVSLARDDRHHVEIFPRNSQGADSCWRWGRVKAHENIRIGSPFDSQVVAKQVRSGSWNVYEKNRRSTQKAKTIWDETEVRTEAGTREVRRLFGAAVFDHPKPVALLSKVIAIGSSDNDIVLDFFAGSGTLAQAAVMQNISDGGSRRFVLVNLPEPVPADSAAAAQGFSTISEMSLERVRRALRELDTSIGVRLYRLGESNFRGARTRAEDVLEFDLSETTLLSDQPHVDGVVAEILLKEGVALDVAWDRYTAGGANVVCADGVAVVVSLDITDAVVGESLAMNPRVIVFLEDGFAGGDAVKANAFTASKDLGITMKTV